MLVLGSSQDHELQGCQSVSFSTYLLPFVFAVIVASLRSLLYPRGKLRRLCAAWRIPPRQGHRFCIYPSAPIRSMRFMVCHDSQNINLPGALPRLILFHVKTQTSTHRIVLSLRSITCSSRRCTFGRIQITPRRRVCYRVKLPSLIRSIEEITKVYSRCCSIFAI